jgi:hypothetical protein
MLRNCQGFDRRPKCPLLGSPHLSDCQIVKLERKYWSVMLIAAREAAWDEILIIVDNAASAVKVQ